MQDPHAPTDHIPGTVRYVRADILASTAFEAIANPVNCVSTMGAGLAKQFAQRYPEILPPYRAACRNGQLRPGSVMLHPLDLGRNPRLIIHFPTKDHWNGRSQLRWTHSGLSAMYHALSESGVRHVALPALGSGHGKLPWRQVKDAIDQAAAANPSIVTTVCPIAPT